MLRGKHYQGYYNKRLRFRKSVKILWIIFLGGITNNLNLGIV